MSGIQSRQAAFQLLKAVRKQNRTLDQAMEGLPELSASDRGFAYRLAKEVLRCSLALDKILDAYLSKPLPPKGWEARFCLQLAAVQILRLDTPDHAAVHSSVELAKRECKPFAGLVNAVSKKLIADQATIMIQGKDCLPPWLWQSWVGAYGEQTAAAIATVQLQEPPLDVHWSQRLTEATPLYAGIQRLPVGVGFGSLDGTGWAQDQAAALPVHLLGEVKGLRVLDACAAPGGKTLQLAQKGAQVTAVDISKNRLKRLEENLARTGLEAEIICADLRDYTPPQPFDMVVLDAPCSATGTLRRHPEIMYQRRPEDITRLAAIQKELLQRSIGWLAPGGKLLYITCSLQPEEGEQQVAACQSQIVPFHAEASNIPHSCITPQGTLRTTPADLADEGGMDGFFAALLQP